MSKDGSSADFAHRLVFSHSLVVGLIVSPGARPSTPLFAIRSRKPSRAVETDRLPTSPARHFSIAPLDFREFPRVFRRHHEPGNTTAEPYYNMAHSLRLITYLVPSHPVEMYECIAHFLEEQLKVSVTLVYESRDPIHLYGDDRPDPFCLKEVDIGFLSPTQYLKMKRSKNVELLPITPVFVHPKNTAQKPGYFADVIVHTDVRKTVKSFLDLRGCNWGYTGDNSLSSSVIIQKLLRTNGENSSFFGNTIKTGNHLLTVEKVQDKQVIAAAVDSTAFYNYKNVLHKDADDITVLDSVGALPPYAIVCGKYLNGDLKSRIVGALLKATITRPWKVQFDRFGLIKFVENSNDAYTELEFNEPLDGNGLSAVYY